MRSWSGSGPCSGPAIAPPGARAASRIDIAPARFSMMFFGVPGFAMLLVGLGICIAFRGGVINIGGEGQLVTGPVRALVGTVFDVMARTAWEETWNRR